MKDYNWLFYVHITSTIISLLSWLLIDWVLIAIGIILFYLQPYVIGTCVLTKAQFKGKERSFYTYYLRKWGFNVTYEQVRAVIEYTFPPVVFCLALLWQLLLKHRPLLF